PLDKSRKWAYLRGKIRRVHVPRRSRAELEMEGIAAGIGNVLSYGRPEPPAGMLEAAAKVWRDSVASMKEMHFSRETHALLTRYCVAMAECEKLETELIKIEFVPHRVAELAAPDAEQHQQANERHLHRGAPDQRELVHVEHALAHGL